MNDSNLLQPLGQVSTESAWRSASGSSSRDVRQVIANLIAEEVGTLWELAFASVEVEKGFRRISGHATLSLAVHSKTNPGGFWRPLLALYMYVSHRSFQILSSSMCQKQPLLGLNKRKCASVSCSLGSKKKRKFLIILYVFLLKN